MTITLTGHASFFLIYEDGHWEQPTVALARPATEDEIREAVERRYGRKVLLVAGVAEDPDAPDCDGGYPTLFFPPKVTA